MFLKQSRLTLMLCCLRVRVLCLVVCYYWLVKGREGETGEGEMGEERQAQLQAGTDHGSCGQETKYDQRPPFLPPKGLCFA